MPKSSSTTRPERVARLAAALLVALAAGCDAGPPLSECDPGLFDADCGGDTPPVVACERDTGECRWFRTSTVAANHAVSRCGAEDICCEHPFGPWPLAWPFDDWRPPTEAARLRAVGDLGVLRNVFVERGRPPAEVAVSFDAGLPLLEGVVIECPRSRVGWCSGGGGPVEASTLTIERYRAGRSLVIVLRPRVGVAEWIIEVSPSAVGEGLAARVFSLTLSAPDSPTHLAVSCTAGGLSQEVVGSIRLSPDAFDDPTAARGVLDLTWRDGETDFVLRF